MTTISYTNNVWTINGQKMMPEEEYTRLKRAAWLAAADWLQHVYSNGTTVAAIAAGLRQKAAEVEAQQRLAALQATREGGQEEVARDRPAARRSDQSASDFESTERRDC